MRDFSLVLAALIASACTVPTPKSCVDDACTSEEAPFCDVDGTFGAEQPGMCIAVTCEPNELFACRDDNELRCQAQGTNYALVDCPLGCVDGIRCRACEPNETVCSNGAVQACDATGNVTTREACPLGCFADEPRCRDVEPSTASQRTSTSPRIRMS